ncbi:MAG: YebC/PmpR family DNA-binding transcriptional regulator, partial [Patescibacteria group bacterium]
MITISVIEGGGFADPEINIKLRMAVEKAKAANMPKDNIARAIEKAAGPEKNQLKEVVYEGFGPEGMALIIVATTDNPNRTISEVRNTLEKMGGKLGSQGSVAYLFHKCGS